MKARTSGLILSAVLSALSCFAATSANADAHVDRSLLKGPAQGVGTNTDNVYTVTIDGATIYNKNQVYLMPFPLPAHLNVHAIITNVAWQYGVQSHPVGFEAAICWKHNSSCQKVTNVPVGQTAAFNGLDALQPFTMAYQVLGVGKMMPVVGQQAQLVVYYKVVP